MAWPMAEFRLLASVQDGDALLSPRDCLPLKLADQSSQGEAGDLYLLTGVAR